MYVFSVTCPLEEGERTCSSGQRECSSHQVALLLCVHVAVACGCGCAGRAASVFEAPTQWHIRAALSTVW